MKITAIGTGGAFTYSNFHTNFVVDADCGKKMLVDCGSDARHALRAIGLTHRDIDAVYVSHLHGDHVGGLEWLGFARYFDPECDRSTLILSESLEQPLWNNVLAGGMSSLQGTVAKLGTYFSVSAIPQNGAFTLDDGKAMFQIVQTCHVMNGYYIVPSFGLMVRSETGKTAFITTDTQYAPEQISDFYAEADVVFHDCETLMTPPGSQRLATAKPLESRVHAHYTRLRQLPDETRAKMWLVHYGDDAHEWFEPENDGFLGFMEKGQTVEM